MSICRWTRFRQQMNNAAVPVSGNGGIVISLK